MPIFRNLPKILAHVSSVKSKNFVTPEFILNKKNNEINLFNRYCPHRMYPLHALGDQIEEVQCNFHGFKWDRNGVAINNDLQIKCGIAHIGNSGLIFTNFIEPNHSWVNDLKNEKNLEYSHTLQGTSSGSWLWMMEIQADLSHIRKGNNTIHPWLSEIENLNDVKMDHGDNWILQTCSTGWWLFVYPFTFIEWSKGCLSINYTVPKNYCDEYGFDWNTQFYYDPKIQNDRRVQFEKLEDVFREDVIAIEKQKGKYFPLKISSNKYEDHCVHFGQWVMKNKE